MSNRFELTAEGFAKLTAELEELKASGRKKVAERIKETKQSGDFLESSEYESAKAEQAYIEGRIEEIQHILQNAQVIADPSADGTIGVGSRVRLLELRTGEELQYLIVGSVEADPAEGRISNQSPVGEALLGKKQDDVVKVQTPRGVGQYRVLEVKKPKKVRSEK